MALTVLKSIAFLSLLALCAAKYDITTISDFKTGLGGAPHWDAKRYERKVYTAILKMDSKILKQVDFIVPIKGSKDLFAIGDANRVGDAKKKHNIFPLVELMIGMVCFMHRCNNNGSIWKINPKTSKVLEIIELPTEITVNAVFGGPYLDVLFVTSADMMMLMKQQQSRKPYHQPQVHYSSLRDLVQKDTIAEN